LFAFEPTITVVSDIATLFPKPFDEDEGAGAVRKDARHPLDASKDGKL